jgi:NifB/MoaA-like Fe-S oxidoreductase
MRKSLSVKDDDYRLSFLYGNFTTLTRFTEADLERVITEQLSPLYVSIHATDPDTRARLLRNRRGATSLRWLSALLDAGIEVHGQVVVCPGINDGDVLDDTLLGVLDRYPRLASVGVVPLGVSDHTTEPEMRAHTVAEAARVLDVVAEWQSRFTEALGRRLVFASDEYYLLAGRPFPALDAYDGLPQHENGIGMATQFEREVRAALAGDGPAVDVIGPRTGFFAWVDGAPAEGYRAPRGTDSLTDSANSANPCANSVSPRADSTTDSLNSVSPRADSVNSVSPRADSAADSVPVMLRTMGRSPAPITILTGEYGARVLAPVTADLAAAAGTSVRLLPVANRFFGGNIAVTGLLTGPDLVAALADAPASERFLLPDVVLSNGRFLDGTTPADLPRAVEVVATDGASLVAAVRGRS